jgi:ATP-dependent DNA helicase PIF1
MPLAPLNPEQQNVVNYLNRTSEHLFITGKAGTGKTHVLHWFQQLSHKKSVICAPTGIAALNAGGSTIHNLLGLGTGLPADSHVDFKTIHNVRKTLDGVEVIVIDEVSMVNAPMMDAIDRVLRRVTGDFRPFGGLQIVMFGDIYQLPPVVTDDDRKYYNREGYRSEWFFDADVWEEAPFQTFGLETIHRQSDSAFKDILNGVRDGTVTAKQLKELNAVGARTAPSKSSKLLLLGSTRKMVAEHNAAALKRLKGRSKEYTARVNTGFGIQEPADRKLMLKQGAHVMMISNDRQERWVNGSQGIVTALDARCVYVDIEGAQHAVEPFAWVNAGTAPEDYKTAPKFWQIPMRTAWGVTIHKAQGLSLDEIQVDLGYGAFSAGQTYVALSRVRSPQGLYLRSPIRMSDIKVDENVRRFFDSL